MRRKDVRLAIVVGALAVLGATAFGVGQSEAGSAALGLLAGFAKDLMRSE